MFEQKQRKWSKKVKDSENACHEIIRTHEKENEQLEKEIIHRDIEMVNLRKNLETSEVAFNELMMTEAMNSEHLINTENRLEKALTKLSLTAKELEEMKTSKTMDSRLKEKESNGSNKHSPSKLAERYAELYDNQWTDAYEHLERYFHRDEDIIQALLTILQDMVEFCTEKAKRQIDDLQRNLTFSDTQAGGHVPQNITQQLKDFRKALCTVSKESLYKLYISSLQKTTHPYLKRALEIRFFVDDCFEICWLMAIQDPPIVLSPVARTGETLNTDIYKSYTNCGRYIQFVVWPAMLLHQDGPVLAKGVAQGNREKGKKPRQAWFVA